MKILHVADIHCKPQIWSGLMSVVGDVKEALVKLSEYATSHRISTVVLSGDIFDSTKPCSDDVSAISSFCSKFESVLFIMGTHDTTNPPWMRLVPNAVHLSNETPYVSKDGTTFLGIDYCRTRNIFLEELSKLKTFTGDFKRTVLVTHNAYRHLLGFDGAWKAEATDIEALSSDLHVLAGDVHIRKTLSIGDSGWIHSAGPLCPQDWGQTEYTCYADVIDTDTWEISPVDTTVRHYHTISLEDVPAFKDDPSILPTVVRVLVPAGTLDAPDVVIPGVVVTTQLVGSSDGCSGDDSARLSGMSVEDAIKEELPDDPYQTVMLGLWHSDSPREHITNMLREHSITLR